MSDTRELILARCLAILGTVADIKAPAVRNKPLNSEETGPLAGFFDGEDDIDPEFAARVASPPARIPQLIDMRQEFLFRVSADHETVGATLNGFRVNLIKLILSDAELASIIGIGEGGSIRYDGCAPSFVVGRQTVGTMGVAFVFRYPLIPAQL